MLASPAAHPDGILVLLSIPAGPSSRSPRVSPVTPRQGQGRGFCPDTPKVTKKSHRKAELAPCPALQPPHQGTVAGASTQGAFYTAGKPLQHKQGLWAPWLGFGRRWATGNRAMEKFSGGSGWRQDQTGRRNELL